MADPISATLMIVGAVSGIAGGFLNAAASKSQKEALNAQLAANADAERINANIQAKNAALAAQERQNQLAESRRKYALLQGQTRAQGAAMGLFGGSTLDLLSDLEGQQILEQTSIVTRTVTEQQNAMNQRAAALRRADALMAGQNKSTADQWASVISGFGSAAGSLVGGPGGGIGKAIGG